MAEQPKAAPTLAEAVEKIKKEGLSPEDTAQELIKLAYAVFHAPAEVINARQTDLESAEEPKKDAARAMSTMGFGTATLVGFLAIVLAGVVVGAQKLSAWSKSFDAGLKLAYTGGMKGGGGKKEKG